MFLTHCLKPIRFSNISILKTIYELVGSFSKLKRLPRRYSWINGDQRFREKCFEVDRKICESVNLFNSHINAMNEILSLLPLGGTGGRFDTTPLTQSCLQHFLTDR